MGKEWRFEQRGGAGRTMTLAGEAAPHGRPRRGPVVTDGIKLRKQRVHYPDSGDAPPTTHIFGIQWDDWELRGRFADRYLGRGGTKTAIEAWQSFVADARPVLISWGDILSAEGIVDSFEPGRESEYESTYRIVVCIDRRNIESRVSAIIVPAAPRDITERLQGELAELLTPTAAVPKPTLMESLSGLLNGELLDAVDGYVNQLSAGSSLLVEASGEFDEFVEGTFDQLERIRAIAVQERTALEAFERTIAAADNDAALFARGADADVQWFAIRANVAAATQRMIALLDELDREAELAQRGRILDIYQARGGDTWESISTRYYGGPDNAGAIRAANGVRFGELPVPGRTYQIPIAA